MDKEVQLRKCVLVITIYSLYLACGTHNNTRTDCIFLSVCLLFSFLTSGHSFKLPEASTVSQTSSLGSPSSLSALPLLLYYEICFSERSQRMLGMYGSDGKFSSHFWPSALLQLNRHTFTTTSRHFWHRKFDDTVTSPSSVTQQTLK